MQILSFDLAAVTFCVFILYMMIGLTISAVTLESKKCRWFLMSVFTAAMVVIYGILLYGVESKMDNVQVYCPVCGVCQTWIKTDYQQLHRSKYIKLKRFNE